MNSILERINPQEMLLLGEGSVVRGTLKNEEAALIHGTMDGEVSCGSLLIARGGQVKGRVEARYLELWGEIDANSRVGKAYFLRGSVMRGVVLAKSAGIVPGATLEGSLVFQAVEDERDEAQESG
ncbi:polymer-forming cytoskeletal protein [Thermatribacter velox]|jgi:cytoskeletal protein CcmA (bactofilin family)|uniref:Polymer-forming cytoskeletal protein n=1 Tax=Thermatribacter velox TaxID=3039681 RepID=A0ABZ2YBX6_9BACT